MTRMESLFGKMKQTWMKVLAGGSLLALLIFLFPPLFGEGYDAINNLLNGDDSENLLSGLSYAISQLGKIAGYESNLDEIIERLESCKIELRIYPKRW